MNSSDYEFALTLQELFNQEINTESPVDGLVYRSNKNNDRTRSLTDPSWEVIDPTPNIHTLFAAFNEKYFQNRLLAVCVSWSKRMTSCAGVCRYDGRGGLCHITLSEPLLKLRPRKDLVETLLHEMIHAYLFVTNNNRDRDGHGPEFHRHMYRINALAGTNITVYHDFHDEVRQYKQHWWRCDGPCQHRRPFFGTLRRAVNRAPGPNDRWWTEHQLTCGGTFIKIKEPEKFQKAKPSKPVSSNSNIRKFFPTLKIHNPDSSNNNIVGSDDSSSTVVIVPKSKTKEDAKSIQSKPTSVRAFSGNGQVLTEGKDVNGGFDYSIVRNHWINKFPGISQTVPTVTKRPADDSSNCDTNNKRIKCNDDNGVECPICAIKMPIKMINKHLDNCMDGKDKSESSSNNKPLKSLANRDDVVKETIPCRVCGEMITESSLNTHLDECSDNHVESVRNRNSKPSNCPVCDRIIDEEDFDRHVASCLGEVFCEDNDVECINTSETVSCLVCGNIIVKSVLNEHLDECMGDEIFVFDDDSIDNNNKNNKEQAKAAEEDKIFNCPVCFRYFLIDEMDGHLDKCLNDTERSILIEDC